MYVTPIVVSVATNAWKNSKAQKALDKIRNEKVTEIDSKTGLRLRNEKKSVDEDLKNVNPTFNSKVMATATNCVYCTATTEARIRGYDVSANLRSRMMNGMKEISQIYPGGKSKYVDSFNILDKAKSNNDGPVFNSNDPTASTRLTAARYNALASNNTDHAKAVIKELSREKNSRGALFITWGAGGGHAVNYEVKNGKVRIIDGQRNKIYSGKDAEDLLSKTVLASSYRLDNLKFDHERGKEAMR